jgi:hypothetical protein
MLNYIEIPRQTTQKLLQLTKHLSGNVTACKINLKVNWISKNQGINIKNIQ